MISKNASPTGTVDFTAPPRHPGNNTTMRTEGCFLAGYATYSKPPLNRVLIDLVAADETRMNYSDRPMLQIELPVNKEHIRQVANEFELIADKLKGIAEALEDKEAEAMIKDLKLALYGEVA